MNTYNNDEYEVIMVESTAPPDGVTEGSWHRYIIQCGNSIMHGKSLGTLKQVTEHAEKVAVQINSRKNHTWGQRKR